MLSYLLIVMFQFTANAQGDEEKKKDGEDEEEEQEEKIEEEEEEFSDDGDYNQVCGCFRKWTSIFKELESKCFMFLQYELYLLCLSIVCLPRSTSLSVIL